MTIQLFAAENRFLVTDDGNASDGFRLYFLDREEPYMRISRKQAAELAAYLTSPPVTASEQEPQITTQKPAVTHLPTPGLRRPGAGVNLETSR